MAAPDEILVWQQFVNRAPVHFDNNATKYTDALQTLALGLPPDKFGVSYQQHHTLLLNAVDVLQQVGKRVFYDFALERVADVISAIEVQGVDGVEVYANGKPMALTDDLAILLTASPYTSWKLRLWWDRRPYIDHRVHVSYVATLYQSVKRQALATYSMQTNTHSYFAGVAEPLHLT